MLHGWEIVAEPGGCEDSFLVESHTSQGHKVGVLAHGEEEKILSAQAEWQ